MDISYISKSFSLKHCEQYRLSIQATLNGFSFCVQDVHRNMFTLFKHFEIDVHGNFEYFAKRLREIVESENLFAKTFMQVKFLYFTPNNTLVPEVLREKNLKSYLGFQHEVHEFDELHHDHLQGFKSYNVYTLPSEIPNMFVNRFKNINYFNQTTILISLGQDILAKKNLADVCLIHKSEKFFDVVIFKNRKLELCNTFFYETGNDLVYYFISTLKKLGLSETDIPVYYSGGIPGDLNEDVSMLRRFVKNFKMNEPYQINSTGNAPLFKKYRMYHFTPLYSLNYCV